MGFEYSSHILDYAKSTASPVLCNSNYCVFQDSFMFVWTQKTLSCQFY